MGKVRATYRDGVFRPHEPIDLPDDAQVEFEPRVVEGNGNEPSPETDAGLQRIYRILGERFESGESDVAARHNEHQP